MEQKIETLFTYVKALNEADLDRLIRFVLSIVSLIPADDKPACPHCSGQHVIKNGHVRGKQRFFCHGSESLDSSADKFGLSHQTAFNMRHKVLMVL